MKIIQKFLIIFGIYKKDKYYFKKNNIEFKNYFY